MIILGIPVGILHAWGVGRDRVTFLFLCSIVDLTLELYLLLPLSSWQGPTVLSSVMTTGKDLRSKEERPRWGGKDRDNNPCYQVPAKSRGFFIGSCLALHRSGVRRRLLLLHEHQPQWAEMHLTAVFGRSVRATYALAIAQIAAHPGIEMIWGSDARL